MRLQIANCRFQTGIGRAAMLTLALLAGGQAEAALHEYREGLENQGDVASVRAHAAVALEDLTDARRAGPVVIGSGLTAENAGMLLAAADGAIVASTLRPGGDLSKRVEPGRVEELMQVVRGMRS